MQRCFGLPFKSYAMYKTVFKAHMHSILKDISPEYSLEGLMLKLKLQYLAT